MPPDPELLAEVGAWIGKARRDIDTARYELLADPPFAEDAAFHAQQAAEKALKALLTWHSRLFRKTHNLVELGQQCVEFAPDLEPLLRRAAPLTEFAWKFRYPGDPDRIDPEVARAALATAEEVVEAVAARIPFTPPASA